MYRIIKILNNNRILVLDGDTGRELILPGNGIGFDHRIGERLEQVKEVKRYKLVTKKSTALQRVNSTDPALIETAGNIIESAGKTLRDIGSNILIPMADHIALAANRARERRELPNPFNQNVRALFDQEYRAAMEGREIIREITGIVVFEDGVGYIILHIHAGSPEEDMVHSIDIVRLVQDSIRSIEEKMSTKLATDFLGYNRLVSRLRYMIVRIRKGGLVSLDMEAYAGDAFPRPYQAVVDVCEDVKGWLGMSVASQEASFLTIHVQRIIQGEQEGPGPTSGETSSRSVYLLTF